MAFAELVADDAPLVDSPSGAGDTEAFQGHLLHPGASLGSTGAALASVEIRKRPDSSVAGTCCVVALVVEASEESSWPHRSWVVVDSTAERMACLERWSDDRGAAAEAQKDSQDKRLEIGIKDGLEEL